LQSVYWNDLSEVASISELCKIYPELIDLLPTTPEFIASTPAKQSSAKIHNQESDNTSSLTNTVSFCSNFSCVAVDRMFYAVFSSNERIIRFSWKWRRRSTTKNFSGITSMTKMEKSLVG
jgi:hypothetical protein